MASKNPPKETWLGLPSKFPVLLAIPAGLEHKTRRNKHCVLLMTDSARHVVRMGSGTNGFNFNLC